MREFKTDRETISFYFQILKRNRNHVRWKQKRARLLPARALNIKLWQCMFYLTVLPIRSEPFLSLSASSGLFVAKLQPPHLHLYFNFTSMPAVFMRPELRLRYASKQRKSEVTMLNPIQNALLRFELTLDTFIKGMIEKPKPKAKPRGKIAYWRGQMYRIGEPAEKWPKPGSVLYWRGAAYVVPETPPAEASSPPAHCYYLRGSKYVPPESTL